ncbi:B3 domain-containing protein REM3-like isoform X2 [Amaranthus tricolor]|uniref:B3 domain-containing protein REM3-like isoform X2 n=2 Tax=Amaranthus tricolor TaxID=29722 RepID=UPI00258DBBE1|nr:B3 domain-containing protein REM3-like isoform X2 [Amaranthus tricolor]
MDGYVPHRIIIESEVTKKCWRVDVEEDGDRRMYFRGGWADFVEAHSLEAGNFLLFEYEEQSIFLVRIYGRNGCEKTMLVESTKDLHKPNNTADGETVEEIEAVDSEPESIECGQRKTRSLAPRKCIYKPRQAIPRSYTKSCRVSVSQNALSFSVTMHKYKKHQFNQLTVPKVISLGKKLPSKDQLTFQDANGNSWTVKLAHRRDGRALFATGWKDFLADNKVSPGDKLSFDFMTDELIRVKVTKMSKFKHRSDEPDEPFELECKEDQPSSIAPDDNDNAFETPTTKKKIISCMSGKSFSFVWRMSIARTYLHMPIQVVRAQNLMKKDILVLRDPETKCWPVEVKKLSGNRVALAKGWVEFWKGYGLTNGDNLTFDFVSENLIQVSINRFKRLVEPDVITYLDSKDDNEEAAGIETEAIATREETDAAIATRNEFAVAIEPEDVMTEEGSDAIVEPEVGMGR